MPLLLLGFRDEFTGRPWQPPGRHWPGSPLVGGLDEQAGGTWLAVDPGLPRAACILNARGPQAPASTRRSRGELPLRAAAEGQEALRHLHGDRHTLARYDPFFLICADVNRQTPNGPRAGALMLSWDGTRAALEQLKSPGTHVITNAGHTYPSGREDAKAEHFGAKFAAHRPDADPAATIKDAWADWLTLAGGDGLSETDPAAIVVRHELPDGQVYGTTSVSLVALGASGLRYDFQPVPADPTTWYSVVTQRVALGKGPAVVAGRSPAPSLAQAPGPALASRFAYCSPGRPRSKPLELRRTRSTPASPSR